LRATLGYMTRLCYHAGEGVDILLDLAQLDAPSDAVNATDALARRLGEASPDHAVVIRRHAVDILPDQPLVGHAGASGPAGRPTTEVSADLHVGPAAP
jgi:hypothetical protein